MLITEACVHAQSMVESGDEVSPDLIARLLKIKLMAFRDEALEHRAAEAAKLQGGEVCKTKPLFDQ